MTYALSAPLQAALYDLLTADAALSALVGGHVYDAVPPGEVPPLYVALGAERVRERSDGTGAGAQHDITVSVITGAAGFAQAKVAAGAVCDAFDGARPPLSRGRIVAMTFQKARARREQTGAVRRIDLTFRARLDDA